MFETGSDSETRRASSVAVLDSVWCDVIATSWDLLASLDERPGRRGPPRRPRQSVRPRTETGETQGASAGSGRDSRLGKQTLCQLSHSRSGRLPSYQRVGSAPTGTERGSHRAARTRRLGATVPTGQIRAGWSAANWRPDGRGRAGAFRQMRCSLGIRMGTDRARAAVPGARPVEGARSSRDRWREVRQAANRAGGRVPRRDPTATEVGVRSWPPARRGPIAFDMGEQIGERRPRRRAINRPSSTVEGLGSP